MGSEQIYGKVAKKVATQIHGSLEEWEPARSQQELWTGNGRKKKQKWSLKAVFSNSFLAYHCHNTKHVHVPLSQYKTCTCTTVTTQNMYTYHCHNSKHVHVPLSRSKTRTRTTVTTQNMYIYHCHNSKHVHVPLGIANIIACFQDTGFRSASLWKPQISQLLLF